MEKGKTSKPATPKEKTGTIIYGFAGAGKRSLAREIELNMVHDQEVLFGSHYDCEHISVEELMIRLKSMIRGMDEYDARAAIILEEFGYMLSTNEDHIDDRVWELLLEIKKRGSPIIATSRTLVWPEKTKDKIEQIFETEIVMRPKRTAE